MDIKIAGKGNKFSSVSIGIEVLPEMTLVPFSTMDKKMIRQALFCFLNFVLFSDLQSLVSIAENQHEDAQAFHLCVKTEICAY